MNVLIAGMDTQDNPFTRLALTCDIDPIHIASASTKEIPLADAAIICTSNVSHLLQSQVKDKFKDKKIFFPKHGASSIKQEFEDFYLNSYKSILTTLTAKQVVMYCVARTTKINKTFNRRLLTHKINLHALPMPDYNISNSVRSMIKEDLLIRPNKGSASLLFRGLTPYYFQEFIMLGLPLDKSCVREEYDPETPEVPVTLIDSKLEDKKAQEDIILETLQNIQDNMIKKEGLQDLLRAELAGISTSFFKKVEDTLGHHFKLFKVYSNFKRMNKKQLDVVIQMINGVFKYTDTLEEKQEV